jgi:hypothetical protein
MMAAGLHSLDRRRVDRLTVGVARAVKPWRFIGIVQYRLLEK